MQILKGDVHMRRFDYSFLEHGMLPSVLATVVGAISGLRERENALKATYPDVFTRLESLAKVQSVKGSNEIEGIVTSEQRINEIVNQNSAPLNHNEAEIAGYRDALALVHSDYAALDVRESDILRLRAIMLSYSQIGGGRYKDSDNAIMEVAADGTRRVRFAPTSAAETAETMEQLILAYMDVRDNSAVNRLLLIPCFILDFLCIHPFSDGNGRISRLLSLLSLYKNGFDAGRYISLEEQINRNKSWYYKSLKDGSDGWHTGENSYFPFIENFFATLLMCYKELDKRFAVVGSGKVTKRGRIEATMLSSLLPISKREICRILPDVSPTTVEAVVASMLKSGAIEKIGSKHQIYQAVGRSIDRK
jgi:Fic family protein